MSYNESRAISRYASWNRREFLAESFRALFDHDREKLKSIDPGLTNVLATGNDVADYGWSQNRDVRPEDVTCTIYSALGIDYTTVRHDDPLNRGFEYVPFAKDGTYKPVEELF